MTGKPKNYRVRDILLDSETMELLNLVSNQLQISNTQLIRAILREKLMEFRAMDIKTIKLAVIGEELPKKP